MYDIIDKRSVVEIVKMWMLFHWYDFVADLILLALNVVFY